MAWLLEDSAQEQRQGALATAGTTGSSTRTTGLGPEPGLELVAGWWTVARWQAGVRLVAGRPLA